MPLTDGYFLTGKKEFIHGGDGSDFFVPPRAKYVHSAGL
jgi:hypothetical protein